MKEAEERKSLRGISSVLCRSELLGAAGVRQLVLGKRKQAFPLVRTHHELFTFTKTDMARICGTYEDEQINVPLRSEFFHELLGDSVTKCVTFSLPFIHDNND